MTKTVLCYGDSNTHGFIPGTHGRYDSDTRWTGVLSRLLGDGYKVIEEGLSGRTAGRDNAEDYWRNGFDYLRPCMLSHLPFDYLVIMLGTNDCKYYMNQTPEMITQSMRNLVKEARIVLDERGSDARIIICSPVPIDDDVIHTEWQNECNLESAEKSRRLAGLYKDAAIELDCLFFDAGSVASVSKLDCEHLTAEGHRAVAEALRDIIEKNMQL